MDSDLNYAVLDRDLIEMPKFLAEFTSDEPLSFRFVETDNEDYFGEEDLGFGKDVHIIVYGPKPFSQQEANAFYREMLDYEALAYAVVDWKLTEIPEFLADVTVDEPTYFRFVDAINEDDPGFGDDVYIVVYGPDPFSQHMANDFYRIVKTSEASIEAEDSKTA